MTETAETLRRKISSAADLQSVVRTMKALAASGLTQYERAVHSLDDYCRTVELGLIACLAQPGTQREEVRAGSNRGATGAVVFGSDLGLVGQFNEVLTDFAMEQLSAMPGNKRIMAVGERVLGYLPRAVMTGNAPNSIAAITQLVGHILQDIDAQRGEVAEVYLFHNRPRSGSLYEPVMQRLLPFDATWRQQLAAQPWPTGNLPEVIHAMTEQALIREYLFISLFRACAESMASENASRLAAMQRAEKNIEEQLTDLNQDFNQLRQSSIDEELFDVIAGFEALQRC
ncbi:MAG: F0F1 ATP synthase subunit gamma [Gallionella sp.]|jgi:F-type H+-transporting ATPase subunit gamma